MLQKNNSSIIADFFAILVRYLSNCNANKTPEDVIAQDVINRKVEFSGSWAFGQKERMHQLLEAEGIIFSEDERVDMKRYGWDLTHDLTEEALKHILDDASNTPVKASERLIYLMRTDPPRLFVVQRIRNDCSAIEVRRCLYV